MQPSFRAIVVCKFSLLLWLGWHCSTIGAFGGETKDVLGAVSQKFLERIPSCSFSYELDYPNRGIKEFVKFTLSGSNFRYDVVRSFEGGDEQSEVFCFDGVNLSHFDSETSVLSIGSEQADEMYRSELYRFFKTNPLFAGFFEITSIDGVPDVGFRKEDAFSIASVFNGPLVLRPRPSEGDDRGKTSITIWNEKEDVKLGSAEWDLKLGQAVEVKLQATSAQGGKYSSSWNARAFKELVKSENVYLPCDVSYSGFSDEWDYSLVVKDNSVKIIPDGSLDQSFFKIPSTTANYIVDVDLGGVTKRPADE